METSSRKLSQMLIGLLFILIGGIAIFLSIFSLGPLPISKDMAAVYWLIFAGGMNVVGGIVRLFTYRHSVLIILAAVLFVVNLIPGIQQVISGNYFLFPIIVVLLVLVIAIGAVDLWDRNKWSKEYNKKAR